MPNPYIKPNEPTKVWLNNEIMFILRRGLLHGVLSIGWECVQANQPSIQAAQDNTIYFDVISKRRIGVQGIKYYKRNPTDTWFQPDVWYESWLVQVSAFRKRNEDDYTKTITSQDAIVQMQAFVNSPQGLKANLLWETTEPPVDWLDVVRATDIRDIEFETDSGLIEKFPQFDFELIVERRNAFGSGKEMEIIVDGETHAV